MFIVTYKNFFIAITVLLVAASLFLVGSRGLKEGIDFTGGSVLEVEYLASRPSVDSVKEAIEKAGISSPVIQTAGDKGMIIRMESIDETQHQALVQALGGSLEVGTSTSAGVVEKQFNTIGPTIGSELRQKSIYSIALVILLIVLYIAFAFRHVSRPIKSWKYGLIAIVTLLHDVALPLGFIVLYGGEVNALFVTAILAILGFSIHDTIVVFDRIRENLRIAGKKEEFSETVGKSLNQTFARSINTSLTVVLVLLALYFVGGESTEEFALTLIVGIVAGTYSSIFFASPLLVQLYNWQEKK